MRNVEREGAREMEKDREESGERRQGWKIKGGWYCAVEVIRSLFSFWKRIFLFLIHNSTDLFYLRLLKFLFFQKFYVLMDIVIHIFSICLILMYFYLTLQIPKQNEVIALCSP